MKKIAAAIAALMMTLGLALAAGTTTATAGPGIAPQSKAKAVMTDVTHAGDDSGYAAPIHIVCRNDGSHRYLYTGESSFMSGKACGGLGVDRIVVGVGQAVRCFNSLPPYQSLYYMKTADVPSYASLRCYMQRPLRRHLR